MTDNQLTLKAEVKENKEVKEENYHLRERRHGSFTRTLNMPMGVDTEKVKVVHEDGVLTLHLPKSKAVKPKKITIKTVAETKK